MIYSRAFYLEEYRRFTQLSESAYRDPERNAFAQLAIASSIAAISAEVFDPFENEYSTIIAEEDKVDRKDGRFPRPWSLSGRGAGRQIVDGNGERVGWMHPASLAVATVKAANHYGTHIANIPDEGSRRDGSETGRDS